MVGYFSQGVNIIKPGRKTTIFYCYFSCYCVSISFVLSQNVIKQSGYNVKIVNACAVNVKAHIDIRVKSGKFGHQVTSDTHLHKVIIQMRRLPYEPSHQDFLCLLRNLFLFNIWNMKQTMPMFEFSHLSEYTWLHPNSVPIYAKIAFPTFDSIHVQISCKNNVTLCFSFLVSVWQN